MDLRINRAAVKTESLYASTTVPSAARSGPDGSWLDPKSISFNCDGSSTQKRGCRPQSHHRIAASIDRRRRCSSLAARRRRYPAAQPRRCGPAGQHHTRWIQLTSASTAPPSRHRRSPPVRRRLGPPTPYAAVALQLARRPHSPPARCDQLGHQMRQYHQVCPRSANVGSESMARTASVENEEGGLLPVVRPRACEEIAGDGTALTSRTHGTV